MKTNTKLILMNFLTATIIITIGLIISKTFICGMICGVIYWFVNDLIELYFKEREEK